MTSGMAFRRRGPASSKGNEVKVYRGHGVCISYGMAGRLAEVSGTPSLPTSLPPSLPPSVSKVVQGRGQVRRGGGG